MTDLPTHLDFHEEGAREGFQIGPGPISTADKLGNRHTPAYAATIG